MKILIDTDWAVFIEDLPTEKQLEFFWAIFDYGNRECSLKCWSKVQPILEKGKIGYYNRLKKLKQYATDTGSDTNTDTDTDTVAVRGNVSVSKKKDICIDSSLSGIRANTSNPPTEDEVLEYARQQNSMAGVGGFACSDKTAQDFYDYYNGIGWCLPNESRTPIKDWRAFLRRWVNKPSFRTGATEPEEEQPFYL